MDNMLKDLPLKELPLSDSSIIKVIGVGGGGGNAVNYMYKKGIKDVTFVVCNTDYQALRCSPVPIKLQLGKEITRGLGAGGRPEVARRAAEESREDIKKMLLDNTEMVFITAGMGGGTGTGASPIIAEVARELGILTVGIVTIPFVFEGQKQIEKALEGVAYLSRYVDALLVINNEKLRDIYPDFDLSNAFSKADDVLADAAKAVSEIITVPGYINTDFADVNTILRDGKVAIMNTGYASGENRISKAIDNALNSPLLNTNDVKGAKKVLLSLCSSDKNQIKMEEISQIHDFMLEVGDDVTVIWGATFDDSLEDEVKITLIATGFDVKDIPGMPSSILEKYDIVDNSGDDEQEMSEENLKANEVQKKEDIKRAVKEIYGDSIKRDSEKEENIEKKSIEKLDSEERKNTVKITMEDLDNIDDEEDKIPAWRKNR